MRLDVKSRRLCVAATLALACGCLVGRAAFGDVSRPTDHDRGDQVRTVDRDETASRLIPKDRSHTPTDRHSCGELVDDNQQNLCIARRAADAAVNQANWARRNFYLGIAGTIAITATLLANVIAVIYARKSSDAAKLAAEAAWESARITKRAMIDAERPIFFPVVGIKPLGFPFEEGATDPIKCFPVVFYRFINYGKTPTRIDHVVAEIFVQPQTPDPPIERYRIIEVFTKTLRYNMPIVHPKSNTGDFRLQLPNPMSNILLAGLLAKETFIWITGYIHYTDLFGGARRTYFCSQFDTNLCFFVPFGGPRYNRHEEFEEEALSRPV